MAGVYNNFNKIEFMNSMFISLYLCYPKNDMGDHVWSLFVMRGVDISTNKKIFFYINILKILEKNINLIFLRKPGDINVAKFLLGRDKGRGIKHQ